MDIAKLSNNWKQLQQKLAKEKKTTDVTPESSSLKRKAEPSSVDSYTPKKQRLDKKRMNGTSSKGIKPKPRSKSFAHEQKPSAAIPSRPATSFTNHEAISADVENEGVSATALAGKYIALDCEMVGVGPTPDDDSQLARVSIVNYHGEQIYDTYVQPKLPVTDYRTAVSGVQPHHLDVGRPFKEVQSDVETFLQGRILVGHYLRSDMAMLQLKHPRIDIRDSSSIPKFKEMVGGRAPKLKDLAKIILGLEIQTGEHNSVEDARAAMMIYKAEKDAFEAEMRKVYSQMPRQTRTTGVGHKKKPNKKKRK